jgi:hypothetical protein
VSEPRSGLSTSRIKSAELALRQTARFHMPLFLCRVLYSTHYILQYCSVSCCVLRLSQDTISVPRLSSDNLEKTHQTARCHIPRDCNLHSYRCENLKSHKLCIMNYKLCERSSGLRHYPDIRLEVLRKVMRNLSQNIFEILIAVSIKAAVIS